MAKNKSSRREFNPMSLAFLDVMSCGFGAVVLIFLILDHSNNEQNNNIEPLVAAEMDLLAEEILEGNTGLVSLRNTISDIDFQIVEAQGLARSIETEINSFLEELAQLENSSNNSEDEIAELQAVIESLEEEARMLRESENQITGNNIRAFVGTGNRQYLTGLILGGNRVLILVDMSASMLDNTIVNIIRRRNMSDSARLNSAKWVRTRNTVDWLTTQLPPPSLYQLYMFNNEVHALLPGTEGQWLEVSNEPQISQAMVNLNQTIPSNGTNLENLFQAVNQLDPLPDNIYLITDGLPTLSNRENNDPSISGRNRQRLFERAIDELPSGIPVNVILLPLEGDPMAASAYWQLAISTGGSFLNPSEDWP